MNNAHWSWWIDDLKKFRRKNGHLRVPAGYITVKGRRLGNWVQRIRVAYNNGTLAESRVKELEGVGFVWSDSDERWKALISHLAEYVEANGSSQVPVTFVDEDGFELGSRLNKARYRISKGLMSEDRIRELSEFGVKASSRQELWASGLRELQEYVKAFGDAQVPYAYISPGGHRLGKWVTTARSSIKNGKLAAARVQQLDELGFIRNIEKPARRDAVLNQNGGDAVTWDKHKARFKDYVREQGHARVPSRYSTEDGFPLGKWVQVVRNARKRGLLTKERIAALDDHGFVWGIKDMRVDEGLYRLRAYVKEHGHSDVPATYVTPDGYPLGRWVHQSRPLPASRKKLEASKSGKTQTRVSAEARWDAGIQELHRYAEMLGNTLVTATYVAPSGYRLGNWVHNVRRAARRGTLAEGRMRQLQAMNFAWSHEPPGSAVTKEANS